MFLIADRKQLQYYYPYCFCTCVLYVLTNRLQEYVPRSVVHTLNVVVFSLFCAWTYAGSHDGQTDD